MVDGTRFASRAGALPGHEVVWAPAAHGRQPHAHVMDRYVAPSSRASLMQATIEAQRALREAATAAATAAARARTMAAVLDETLAALGHVEPMPAGTAQQRPAAPATGALSPREKEVLALVAEGRSNKAIAEALFVSPNTVKTHVASLLHKLRADSRVQLAALAAGRALG